MNPPMIRRTALAALALAAAAPSLAAAPLELPLAPAAGPPSWATGGITPLPHPMFGDAPLFASAFARDASTGAGASYAPPAVTGHRIGSHVDRSRYPYAGALPPSGYTVNPVSGYEVYRAAKNDSNAFRAAQ